MDLCFPKRVLDQHAVWLGKTGSGKSSALRHVVEYLLSQNKRVCVIDPKGDWWGLKISADGRSAGFPVVLFGDFKNPQARDVPINDHSGRHVAELIATGNRPCVIGLRGWTQGAMTRFWVDFAQTLFAMNAGELYLVGDEFHNFAPKQFKGRSENDTQVGIGLHLANRLLSEGRGLGLVCLIASQRPQKVHNDTLTSCETLFAMRVVHAADREAVKAWIDGAGDAERGKEVLATLAGLPRGESWGWSPEIGFGPQRVRFPLFTTFDSFAPPQLQKKVSDKGWASVDLTAVREKLAKVIEEEKAKDPKALQAKVAELQRQLASKPATVVAEPKVIDRPVVDPKEVKRVEDVVTRIEREGDRRIKAAEELAASARELKEQAVMFATAIRQAAGVNVQPAVTRSPQAAHVVPVRAAVPKAIVARVDGDPGAVTPSMQKILDALAWWEVIGVQQIDKGVVAVIAGYTVNGHFTNMLGGLRSAGLIEYPTGGQVELTDAGRERATYPQSPGTLGALHEAWKRKLSPSEWKIVEQVIASHPVAMSKEELSVQAGYTVNGHFTNMLGRLRSFGIITKRGDVAATDLLFPPSLALTQPS